MNKLFSLIFISLCLMLSGCVTSKLPELPEPATNNKLSNAERDLDKATEERLSKLSAQIGVSIWLAEQNQKSKSNQVLIKELKISKNLLGRASQSDWIYAKSRVENALNTVDDESKLNSIYDNEIILAESLVDKLKKADANYEKEKAKKQAEFEAKVIEREQALAQEQAMAKINADEKRKNDFLYLGGFVCLIATGLLVFSPNKIGGLTAMACGMLIASIGRIWATEYFNYFLISIFGIVVIFIGFYLYRFFIKKNESVDKT